MAFVSQLGYMSTAEAAEAAAGAPTITDWAQTIVTVVGIIIAAWVAVRVAAKQHDRQVLHQTKKDVADALVTYEVVKHVFFEVKVMAEFSTGEAELEEHDSGEMREAVERIKEPFERLASLVRFLQLTAPDLIAMHGRNLLAEARGFRGLMMTSHNAYMTADIKRRIGQPEPLRRLTTQAEYEAKYADLNSAEMLLEVATKDFENFTAPWNRLKTFFVILWFRSERFARRRLSQQD